METFIATLLFLLLVATLAWSIHDSDSGDGVVAQASSIVILSIIYLTVVVETNNSEPIVHKSTVEICLVVTNTIVITNGDTVNTVEYTYSFPRE